MSVVSDTALRRIHFQISHYLNYRNQNKQSFLFWIFVEIKWVSFTAFTELHSQVLTWWANTILRTNTHTRQTFFCRYFWFLFLPFYALLECKTKQNKTIHNRIAQKRMKRDQKKPARNKFAITYRIQKFKNRFCQAENGKSLHKFGCI